MWQAREVLMSNVVSVLTQETAKAIIAAGGTEPWTLNPRRAVTSEFLVCCRKASKGLAGLEEVNTAFLVGRVKDVVPSEVSEGRWKITISEYAEVDWPDQWEAEKKNPVAYYFTNEYQDRHKRRVNFEKLEFTPVVDEKITPNATKKLMTVAEAKAGLAATFGVDESAIEITIRM